MFDYNLVSTKAVYRNFIPRDLPDLLGLAARRAEEMKADPAAAREAVSSTVQEFSRHKGRGSVLLIDVEELPVGYCVLSSRWSHARGGTALCVEELYVSQGARARGLEEDLLALLAEIAPSGAVALELGLPAADRRAEAAWRKAGFHREGTTVMIRETRRKTP
jgi:GNAT superfamily N-acetyltransferase